MARVMSVLDFFSKWKCSDLAVFDCVYLFSASLVLLQPSILIFPSTRGGLAQEQGKSKIGAASFTLCTLACFPLLTLSLYWFAHSNVLFLVFICLSVFFCKLLLQPTVLFAFFANCRDRSLSLFPVFANYCICPLFGKFCKSSHQITITIPYVQTCAQYHHPLCFVCTLFDKSFSTIIFDI